MKVPRHQSVKPGLGPLTQATSRSCFMLVAAISLIPRHGKVFHSRPMFLPSDGHINSGICLFGLPLSPEDERDLHPGDTACVESRTAGGRIDIGRRSPTFPVTPPGVRVRTGRFGGLSYRLTVNLGIPSESK